jgi:hypothetical protein
MTDALFRPNAPLRPAPAPDLLSNDLLQGASQIALFLFGDGKQRRRVYHLVQTRRLPVFRIGTTLYARKSSLLTWIEQQEQASTTIESQTR